MTTEAQSTIHLPRVEIKFCVQCKWNLRAAYYAQELLQTFSNTIGEIALVPVTGGTFTITITLTKSSSTSTSTSSASETQHIQIWDRKADGGFPETKELKNRVRNCIDPERDMGHIDRSLKKGQSDTPVAAGGAASGGDGERDAGLGKGDIGGNVVRSGEDKKEGSTGSGKHPHGKEEDETNGMGDCEECRLAATERLEQEIARVSSA